MKVKMVYTWRVIGDEEIRIDHHIVDIKGSLTTLSEIKETEQKIRDKLHKNYVKIVNLIPLAD